MQAFISKQGASALSCSLVQDKSTRTFTFYQMKLWLTVTKSLLQRKDKKTKNHHQFLRQSRQISTTASFPIHQEPAEHSLVSVPASSGTVLGKPSGTRLFHDKHSVEQWLDKFTKGSTEFTLLSTHCDKTPFD